ncbi:MAG: hypothetical protein ABI832_20665 [bacterium]
MAHIVYGEALGDFADPMSALDFGSMQAVVLSARNATFGDLNGAGITINGSGLTYSGTSIAGGTATTVTIFNSNGSPLISVTGAAYDAAKIADVLLVQQNTFPLFSGDDKVDGSSHRDIIAGGNGNDTVHGGDGADLIAGMNGRDKLYGDAGRDMFVFVPNNSGVDKIMDFTDTNHKSDDLIVVKKALYADMIVSQSGQNVVLDFGGKGSLVIVGANADQIGADDFMFHLPHFLTAG